MLMHNEAERLRVLAETLDPPFEQRPYSNSPEAEAYLAWIKRYKQFNAALAIATPGALLGAAVDLFDFALAGKGWEFDMLALEDGSTVIRLSNDATGREIDTKDMDRAAALIAAMEEI